MKDIYKQRADDTIESLISRTKIVKEMVSGDRPADTKQAELYLKEVLYDREELIFVCCHIHSNFGLHKISSIFYLLKSFNYLYK